MSIPDEIARLARANPVAQEPPPGELDRAHLDRLIESAPPARPRGRRRAAGIAGAAACAAAVAGIAALFIATSRGGDTTAAAYDGMSLAVLERPQEPGDVPDSGTPDLARESIRRVGQLAPGIEFYLGRSARDPGFICPTAPDARPDPRTVVAIRCFTRDELRDRGAWATVWPSRTSSSEGADGMRAMSVVVSDGVTHVGAGGQMEAVVDNVAVFRFTGAAPRSITVQGPAIEDLGTADDPGRPDLRTIDLSASPVTALRRPAAPRDRLRDAANPTVSSRLVAETADAGIHLTRMTGERGGLCIIQADPPDTAPLPIARSQTCSSELALSQSGSVVASWTSQPTGAGQEPRTTLAVAVIDGVTHVENGGEVTEVRDNIAVFEVDGDDPRQIALTGPVVRTLLPEADSRASRDPARDDRILVDLVSAGSRQPHVWLLDSREQVESDRIPDLDADQVGPLSRTPIPASVRRIGGTDEVTFSAAIPREAPAEVCVLASTAVAPGGPHSHVGNQACASRTSLAGAGLLAAAWWPFGADGLPATDGRILVGALTADGISEITVDGRAHGIPTGSVFLEFDRGLPEEMALAGGGVFALDSRVVLRKPAADRAVLAFPQVTPGG